LTERAPEPPGGGPLAGLHTAYNAVGASHGEDAVPLKELN